MNFGLDDGMHPAIPVLGRFHHGTKIGQLIHPVGIALSNHNLHHPPIDPLPHVQAPGVGLFQADRNPNHQLAVGAAGLESVMDTLDPGGHEGAAGIHFLGVEVVVVAE